MCALFDLICPTQEPSRHVKTTFGTIFVVDQSCSNDGCLSFLSPSQCDRMVSAPINVGSSRFLGCPCDANLQ
jgi:hypothetical protein